jgi:hypothetical protein
MKPMNGDKDRQPDDQPQPQQPEFQPPLALDTTEEEKTQMRDACKNVPVPEINMDNDLRDKPFKEWPQNVKRKKLLDDLPMSTKANLLGTLFEETSAVYFYTESGKKQLSVLGLCCAVDIEYDEIRDTYLVQNDES